MATKEFTVIKTDNDTYIVKSVEVDGQHTAQALKGFGIFDKVLEEAKHFFQEQEVPF